MRKKRWLSLPLLLALYTVAVLVLVMGVFPSQMLWRKDHHRYDHPNTGAYYGYVKGSFHSTEDASYSLGFAGQTKPRWRWTCPENFTYQSLEIYWQNEEEEGTATVSFPSLAYESSNTTGVLTRSVLADWLLGTTRAARSTGDVHRVDTLYEFIQAAGQGTLPPPNHHGHYFDEPVRGYVQHFLLGFGVGSYFYVWAAVWLLLVLWVSRIIWKRSGDQTRKSHASVAG